jgi:hypothetical protein
MLAAERKSCKSRTKTEWSLPIHHASLMIAYWMIKCKGKRHKIDVSRQLKDIKEKLPEEYQRTLSLSTGAIQTNLHKGRVQKQKLQLQHKELRQASRIDNVKTEAKATGSTVEKIAKKIDHAETSKSIFEAHKMHFHPESRSASIFQIGMKTVIIPMIQRKQRHGQKSRIQRT